MSQESLWENLAREKLEDVLEPEMVRQYRLRRGEQCVYMPRFGTERYLCSCGTINPLGKKCYICGLEPEPLTREVVEELSREAEERLAREREQQEKEEARRRERLEAEKRAKRKKRILLIAGCVLGVLVLLAVSAVLFWAATRVWIPAGHYEDGLEALEAGDLQSAHRSFMLAGDYEDAEAYLERFFTPVTYVRATEKGEVSESFYTYGEKGELLTTRMVTKEVDDLGNIVEESTVSQWVNSYDEAGRELVYEDLYGKAVYTYNERGDVTSINNYRTDGAHDKTRVFVYIYDEQGRIGQRLEICSELISVNYSYEQTDRYTYDHNGNVLTQYTETNYPASAEANYVSEVVNTYDEQGRLIKKEESVVTPNDPMGDCGNVDEWSYDEAGRVVRHYRSCVYPGDPIRDSRILVTTTYDRWGNVTEEITTSAFPGDAQREMVQSSVFVYDGEGKLVEETRSQSFSDAMRQEQSGYTNTAEYIYDLFGRLTEARAVYSYAKPEDCYVQTAVYKYRGDGSRESCTITTKWRTGDEPPHTQTYLYDQNGLEVSYRMVEDENETLTEYTHTYFYFPEGHDNTSVIYPVY